MPFSVPPYATRPSHRMNTLATASGPGVNESSRPSAQFSIVAPDIFTSSAQIGGCSAIKGELAPRECIAIGLGTRDRLRVERATGTGTVLHDHRLLERGIELLSEHARDDVHRPAGRERHDQLDRRTFTELGSGFRLGAVSRMVRPIPEEALQRLSTQVVG